MADETTKVKEFKMNPFLILWLIGMTVTLLVGMLYGAIDPKTGNGFLRIMFLIFGIISFAIGWILGVIGLIFFAVKKGCETGINW